MQVQGYTGIGISPFVDKFGASPFATQNNSGIRTAKEDNDAQAVSHTFSQDIVRRLDSYAQQAVQSDETPANVQKSTDQEQAPKSAEDLGKALENAVNFVRENFGDQAATATMGLIYKNIGNQEITEDTLGEGLLDALKFVDKNFGTQSGDKLMNHFNGELNNSVNNYFDNGLMERFYDASATQGGPHIPKAMTTAIGQISDKFGEDVAASIMDIIESSIDEYGLNTEGLKNGLADAQAYLNETLPGEAGLEAYNILDQGLAQALHMPPPNATASQQADLSGMLLNVTV